MLGRKTTGSVVCPSCGSLVGVRDDRCYMCGRANPSLWGFAPSLRQLGADLGFVPLVLGVSAVLYVLTLIASGSNLQVMGGGFFNILSPGTRALVHYGRKSGSSLVHTQAKQWALIMFVYGLVMPGIDNFAHAGGFAGGYAMSALFNPLTKERGDHLLIAALCLVATFLAIAASV